MLETVFWTGALAALHHHVIYPLSLLALARRAPGADDPAGDLPHVTLIVTGAFTRASARQSCGGTALGVCAVLGAMARTPHVDASSSARALLHDSLPIAQDAASWSFPSLQ